ncbi:MAG TPA: hypothetical protein P5519_06895 [Spirochaetia bacterium]|nr:hypothetical protein [Spirochaetales bacterium]HPD79858.1 hypothetical protein [Spirochaetales bacterium]HQK33287.1 hypothetical protein [Spirochaetales bacterium]HRS65599.1 hypothetical protein [Spirochaetia bacterium]HRV28639.1 hypothetical protein [Spirochaetia bacterium]
MVKRALYTFISILLIVSCVSTAPSASQAPEWTTKTPGPDGTYTYFVGYSSAGNGDIAKATDDATANLVASIMNYIGQKITVDSTAVAKATLESYQADIIQTVKSESKGRITGFLIKEKYIAKSPDGRVTVYILAAYETKELEKEKARIAAIFKEKEDAVSKPESAGDSAVAQGKYFDAIKFYIQAAVAASGSDIDNADIKMERNVNKARNVLSKLRFIKLDAPVSVGMGKAYPKAFTAKLIYGENDNAPGIPGVEIFVTYNRMQTNGRITTKTERLLSNTEGIISFTPPNPDFVGKAKVIFTLNLDSSKDLIDQIPSRFAAYKDSLFEELSRRYIEFEYVISSDAKTVPTGVAIVELDETGNPATTSVAQGGLFEILAKEKFKVGLAPIDISTLLTMNDSQIYNLAKKQYSPSLQRYIYGVARVVQVVKDGSMYQATVTMTVRCIDLSAGMILYSTEKTAIAVGADKAAAIRAALLTVSRETVAKDLLANLP